MPNIFSKILLFLKEVKLEAKRVNWPSSRDVIQNTLVVLGISFALALFLGGFDFLFQNILQRFIHLQ